MRDRSTTARRMAANPGSSASGGSEVSSFMARSAVDGSSSASIVPCRWDNAARIADPRLRAARSRSTASSTAWSASMLSSPISATTDERTPWHGAAAPPSTENRPVAVLVASRITGAGPSMPLARTPRTISVAPTRPSLPGGNSCLAVCPKKPAELSGFAPGTGIALLLTRIGGPSVTANPCEVLTGKASTWRGVIEPSSLSGHCWCPCWSVGCC